MNEDTETIDDSRTEDQKTDLPEPLNQVSWWLSELKRAKFKRWTERSKSIIKRYRDEDRDKENSIGSRFGILWSNIETLKPAIYARAPIPAISPRWKSRDPIALLTGLSLERCARYEMDVLDFDCAAQNARDDFLLVGRGQLWERYEPKIENDDIAEEHSVTDFLYWEDFLHSGGRTWDEVTWVAKRVYLARHEAVQQFGKEIADALNYDQLPEGVDERKQPDIERFSNKAVAYEIWYKPEKKVIQVSPGYDKFLRVADDPLGLRKFFPCPRPLYATTTTDTLEPIPDYAIYQDLANLLDRVTYELSCLTDAVKVMGAYDAALQGLEEMTTKGRRRVLIPVAGFGQFLASGGFDKAIAWWPLDQVIKGIEVLTEIQGEIKNWIFEVSGMSDIVRGQTNPYDTATAQQIKGQYATLRLSSRQAEMQRFLRDVIEIKCEIIARKFQDKTIMSIVGADLVNATIPQIVPGPIDPNTGQPTQQTQEIPIFPEALKTMRSGINMTHKVDIETDSTIAVNESMEKQSRNEFMAALGQLTNQLAQLKQVAPEMLPVFGQTILFTLRAFRAGREIEESIEQAVDKMSAPPPPQEQGPDPAMIKLQQDAQIKQAEMGMTSQIEQGKLGLEAQRLQLDIAKHQSENEKWRNEVMVEMQKIQKESETKIMELQSTVAVEAEKARQALEMKALELQSGAQNKEVEETKKQVSPPVSLNVHIGPPKKKVITPGYDALGNKIYTVDEEPTTVESE